MLTGIGAGLGGMSLALLLHSIQHLAYGYSLDHVIGTMSFLEGVSDAPAGRRFAVMALCGVVAGFAWWVIYRFGRPLISIKSAVSGKEQRMPIVSTTAHAVTQIVTVALGSPLGREVAPREIGAMLGGWLSHYAGLTTAESKLMVACGAGAGLAAVYNVPLAGAIFALEVLLVSFSWPAAIVAIVTSTIAAVVAWIGLGDDIQYTAPQFVLSYSLVTWAVITGPLFGLAAYWYTRLTTKARANAPRNWQLPILSILNFAIIGLFAMHFPQLLGNGKAPVQLGLGGDLTIGLAGMLLVLRVVITISSLRAGAEGGLLTPGLANGALLAVVLGGLWSLAWPGVALGAFAIIGATAFLASSMKMPITATVLVAEFTRVNHDMLIPIVFAVAGSACVNYLCEQWFSGARSATSSNRAAVAAAQPAPVSVASKN